MCGRSARYKQIEAYAKHYGLPPQALAKLQAAEARRPTMQPELIPDDPVEVLRPSYNMPPGATIHIVRLADDGTRELVPVRWGLVPYWVKSPGNAFATHNARVETIQTTPAYREPLRKRRCLIVFDGFYEWYTQEIDGPDGGKKKEVKTPYFIYRPDGLPMTMAGLWDRWTSKETPARVIESATIVTRPANTYMRWVHERMPALLNPDEFAPWLDPTTPHEQVMSLIQHRDWRGVAMHQVDREVSRGGKGMADHPGLIAPVDGPDGEPILSEAPRPPRVELEPEAPLHGVANFGAADEAASEAEASERGERETVVTTCTSCGFQRELGTREQLEDMRAAGYALTSRHCARCKLAHTVSTLADLRTQVGRWLDTPDSAPRRLHVVLQVEPASGDEEPSK